MGRGDRRHCFAVRTGRFKGDDFGWLAAGTCRRAAAQAEVIRGTARHCLPGEVVLVGRMWFAEWYPLPYSLVLDEVLMNCRRGIRWRHPGDVKTGICLPHGQIARRVRTRTCNQYLT